MRKPDSYYVEQAQKYCKEGIKPTGKIVRGHSNKIQVTCSNDEHAPYYTYLNSLSSTRCPMCIRQSRRKTDNTFREEVAKISDGLVSTNDKYEGANKRITFHCNRGLGHRDWKTTPHAVLSGSGCPECSKIKRGINGRKKRADFEIQLYNVTSGSISLVSGYCGMHKKCKMECNLCGHKWYGIPNDIIRGRGCPKCSSSHGEQFVASILEFNNIDYDQQDTTILKGHRLDFVTIDANGNNCVIQPDGEQHYRPIKFMGGKEEFNTRKQKDKYENEQLPKIGYRVLRIPWLWFDLDNTFTLLKEFLGYELKKPDKEYVPAYKRIKDMVYEYLEHGGTKRIAIKYKVSRATVSRNFKNYFGMSRAEYVKLHPEYYVKRSIEHVTRSVVGKSYSGIIVFFSSINSASNWLGIKRSKIDMCLAGKQKTAGGYKWEYAD